MRTTMQALAIWNALDRWNAQSLMTVTVSTCIPIASRSLSVKVLVLPPRTKF